MTVDLDGIRLRMAETAVEVPRSKSRHDAAVAVILRTAGSELEVCLIQRATREGDHWSGHLAFPGGRPSDRDSDLRATAERETLEEIGLDLCGVERLGVAPSVPIVRARRAAEGMLATFVYYWNGAMPSLQPDPREVEAAFFMPLRTLFVPSRRRRIEWAGYHFPAIEVGDALLWGLTLRVCDAWLETLGFDLALAWPQLP